MSATHDQKQALLHLTDTEQVTLTATEHPERDEHQLNELHRRSRSGMWGLFVYLSASLLAYSFRDQSLAALLPEQIMQQLGVVPPVFMATAVLWVSTCSALIIIAGRLFHGTPPSGTVTHLMFRIAFFLLFFIVGGLDQHINAIFISGLTVMALQHHNVVSYYTRQIEVDFTACSCHY